MASPEDQKGAPAPPGDGASVSPEPKQENGAPAETRVSYEPVTDASYAYDDPYTYGDTGSSAGTQAAMPSTAVVPALPAAGGSGGSTLPPPPSGPDGGDDDEGGMLRMSFLEHLEELRSRILRALAGVGVAFAVSLTFSKELWQFVAAPAVDALKQLGFKGPNGGPPGLTMIEPMEVFNIVWVKLPILTAIFIGSPWIVYQIWAFIAPGLYKKERRWAAPFVICSAGLFIAGGLFGYFVAFRFGLTFLLGLGRDNYITPMVSVTHYFDLFVNVMLGIALIFEMPVVIFFLTLLHLASPRFLVANSRYAILGIVIIAAIVTPTPDIFNMMMFAVPMCGLFYVGIFASYLLVLHRENKKFPWRTAMWWFGGILLLLAAAVYLAIARFHYHFVPHWPFLTR
ncbi:MAG: Sec-independent protein translocase TatC [Bryobacterales bacterium]|nr:Sec-independent protein translocase TatC [Bryobacterales bacterium]